MRGCIFGIVSESRVIPHLISTHLFIHKVPPHLMSEESQYLTGDVVLHLLLIYYLHNLF